MSNFYSVDPARLLGQNVKTAKTAMKAGTSKSLAGNLKQSAKLPKSSSRRSSKSL